MIATHTIQDITFDQNSIQLSIDGKLFKISLDKISSKLQSANELQRSLYKISPSGYGIHWPLIDEDLSVDSLMKIAGQ
ncbi:MAG: DUF2442 domain-containing protein [Bacteroidetes bacterium]|jgi:hypothetical protein|nr:DUF2442 domain-containing protein [Bacteroidota bacterium]